MTADGTTAGTAPHERSFMGHPIGLVNLFFTEMWERLSYYGMRAILVLYMVAAVKDGGLAMNNKDAANIFGLYTMAVYLGAMPGGFIADRFLGARKAVLIGGIIIALGHFTMAFPATETFYAGLALIVVGTGLLKPNITSMLGMLYKQGDPRRDGGFSIFYMGVNVGAALAPIVCGYLAQGVEFKQWLDKSGFGAHTSWHWAFAAAGFGMVLGLIHYVVQWKQLGDAGLTPNRHVRNPGDAVDQASPPLSSEEWKRIGAIAVLFGFNILFWTVYEQGGTSLNIFADKCTDTMIGGWYCPSSWLQTFQAVFVITFAPLFSWLWLRLGDKQPPAPAKFAFGLLFLGLGIALMVPASILAAQGKVSPLWLIAVYLLQVLGELCLSPVGLSTVTKLAPARFVGLTMGAWYISNSCGNFLAGKIGGMFDENNLEAMPTLFGSMGVAAVIAAAILACLTPTVKKLMGGVK